MPIISNKKGSRSTINIKTANYCIKSMFSIWQYLVLVWWSESLLKDLSHVYLTILWYDQGYVEISMHEYMPKAIAKFNHKPLPHPQHAWHLWTWPIFNQKMRYAGKDETQQLVRQQPSKSKPYQAHFSSMHVQMIPPSFLHSTKAPINIHNPLKALQNHVNNSWIMYTSISLYKYALSMVLTCESTGSRISLPTAVQPFGSTEEGLQRLPTYHHLVQLLYLRPQMNLASLECHVRGYIGPSIHPTISQHV